LASGQLSIDLPADSSANNYWRVYAVNSAGQQMGSIIPVGARTDVANFTFACSAPAVITAPPGGTTPPTGPGPTGPSPVGPTPPTSNVCTGMSWSAGTTTGHKGSSTPVSISVPSGCQVVLESSNTDNVSVNHTAGNFVNLGSANVCLRSLAGYGSVCQTMTTIP
jgi:hypothetical protein